MDQHEKPKPNTQKPQADDGLSAEERSLLSTLLSSHDTREKALAALGDHDRRFNLLARQFNLRSTYSVVEDPLIDAGTSSRP